MSLKARAISFTNTAGDVNARVIPANFTATNYTPAQVGSEGTDKISAHLNGINSKFASVSGDVRAYLVDLTFNGTDVVKNVDVSSQITDAAKAQIRLLDNGNDFESIYCKITATSASNVRITTGVPLASGTYRLLVFEDISA